MFALATKTGKTVTCLNVLSGYNKLVHRGPEGERKLAKGSRGMLSRDPVELYTPIF